MKKHIKRILLVCLVLLLFWLGIGFYVSRYCLTVTQHSIAVNTLTAPVRIVQISDLHCTDFDEELPNLIAEQMPDLILFTGDLVNQDEEDISVPIRLLEQLCQIAPVYVSMGNHEAEYEQAFQVDLTAAFEETGAHVLDFSYEDIEINGQQLRIGGIYGYCLPDIYTETRPNESSFLYDFQDTDRYTLLLCHMPVCWLINSSLDFWDVDCVFSGHAHGGQVVLPFIGGLYAPDQGWFPGDVQGLFRSDNKHLVVTAGLGGTTPVPRFYNRPEVVVLDLFPASK